MSNSPEQNGAEILAFPNRETLRHHTSELKSLLEECGEAGRDHLATCRHIGRVVQLLEIIDSHPDTSNRLPVHQLVSYILMVQQDGPKESEQFLLGSPAVRRELGRIANLPHPSISHRIQAAQKLLESTSSDNA